ncbi:GNAT family N-acetyltransferase [Pedobacter sp. G11]|uniref:GNAT family N-acetyltransferase n=1 Tax=Pedobacter sp. G11 TaxID=2482728 RepID=UPI000F5EC99A|nr:GNAT family N-acetyltransferase [Pedobacter sp. G11]AZI26775.1 GNAT family N-acetyltransferase [Pedobacter sp. G11]
MCYQVISIQQESKWIHYINNAVDADFFHTWHYHTLEKGGEPILFVYEDKDAFIAFPLVKRAIENSKHFDLTTTYGYGGPVSSKRIAELSMSFVKNFKVAFTEFMSVNKCVCVFSRLNPFLEQRPFLTDLAEPGDNGRTVYVNLTISLDEQRAGYEKRLARQIRQLRKEGYTIRDTQSPDDIKAFTMIYNQNMTRLQADASYFYSEEYFTALLKNNQSGSKLIAIFDNGLMICGSIVLYFRNIIRNHLSATIESHIRKSPSKLLTDEISILGRKLGMRYFHMGGGVGGEEDSLFRFKASFSPLTLQDYTWCFIANKDAYNQLAERQDRNSGFFPVYRTPPNTKGIILSSGELPGSNLSDF